MRKLVACVCFFIVLANVNSYEYSNETVDAVSQQLADFRRRHPKTIGVWTKSNGDPIDIRDTLTLNSDVFNNKHHFLVNSHVDRQRIPERVVHAKGAGAYGYFEVTHDVSKYIKADVFNGIGKKTPVIGRFSTATQNLGGSDLGREMKGVALKFYTNEGNLDLLCVNIPILYKDPIDFLTFTRAFRRNPRTGIFDNTMRWDSLIMRPEFLLIILWLQSDLGIPDGYRKMNNFPIHTYEVYNKHGDEYYVKFNFRTEIGLFNLTNAQAQAIGTEDPDYFIRDLYNAIAAGDYPSWRLEMDILTKDDLTKINYNPFDITRQWRRGTYKTVTVGRLVFNRHVDNIFKDVEQAAFNPDNLVPGIVGPPDSVFKARRVFYPDTQNYRLGVNHDNIRVNAPIYDKNYNRDGYPPLLDNMQDAPNYYPNSFNGPMPYVEEARPTERLFVLQKNAADLEPMSEFYNEVVESDAHRQRIANNFASSLEGVPRDIEKKALKLLTLVDTDLGRRVKIALKIAKARAMIPQKERYDLKAQCLSTT
uniref:Catalase core domain-containing protein n=1 Tax=Heliothis virescens TaxID=7102 RepID=A0A2A4JPV2_HELVI